MYWKRIANEQMGEGGGLGARQKEKHETPKVRKVDLSAHFCCKFNNDVCLEDKLDKAFLAHSPNGVNNNV